MIRKNRKIKYIVLSLDAHTRVLDSWVERFINTYANYLELPKGFSEEDVQTYWIRHLLDIALEYCLTLDPNFKRVYTSERQRFFNDFQNWQLKKKYYDEVLVADIEDIVAEVSSDQQETIRARLIDLHQSIHTPKKEQFKMLVIGDCIFDEILIILRELCAERSIDLNINQTWLGAYSSDKFNQDIISSASNVIDNTVDAVALSFFTYWGVPQFRGLMLGLAQNTISDEGCDDYIESIFDYIRNFISNIRCQSDAPILLHNVSGMPWLLGGRHINDETWAVGVDKPPLAWEFVIGEINSLIEEISCEFENIIVVDEREIVTHHGREHCVETLIPAKFWRNSLFHPRYFGNYLAEEYIYFIDTITTLKNTKALLVDFDNTLWAGVMAEGSVTHYKEHQLLLKSLAQQGILLIALSKNAPENIRWSELYLSKKDFVRLDVSWENKVDIISDISKDLNIGMDSFVFIDDCTRQLGLVEHYYPQVKCLNSEDPTTWGKLKLLFKMKNTSKTDTAKNRTEIYKQQALRKKSLSDQNGNQGYSLVPLNIQVDMCELTEDEIDRSIELLERTNQFNCTGKHYTKAELLHIIESPTNYAYRFILKDKFGEMGFVGLVVMQIDNHAKKISFESLVMSCRAMGYGLEDYMVSNIIKKFPSFSFIGYIKKTNKNGPSHNLYEKMAFTESGSEGKWFFDFNQKIPESPHWINLQ